MGTGMERGEIDELGRVVSTKIRKKKRGKNSHRKKKGK